jgi:hypothetical protein
MEAVQANGNITIPVDITLSSGEWGPLVDYARETGLTLEETVSRALWEGSGINSLKDRDLKKGMSSGPAQAFWQRKEREEAAFLAGLRKTTAKAKKGGAR